MNDSRGNNGRYLILVCCVMMKRERPALGDPFSDLASLASSARASQSSMSRHEEAVVRDRGGDGGGFGDA